MKVLYVHGSDYTALDFERSDWTIDDVVGIIEAGQEPSKIIGEDLDMRIEFDLLEFEDIDIKFIEFVKNEIQDYDRSKDSNFYVINDKEWDYDELDDRLPCGCCACCGCSCDDYYFDDEE